MSSSGKGKKRNMVARLLITSGFMLLSTLPAFADCNQEI
jgi:hypothetical protein